MRIEEALVEAKRRWGPEAAVCNGEGDASCVVGVCEEGAFFVRGLGPTWRAAFENADAYARVRGGFPGGTRAAG